VPGGGGLLQPVGAEVARPPASLLRVDLYQVHPLDLVSADVELPADEAARRHRTAGKRERVAEGREHFRPVHRTEVLATLGDSLALARGSMSASSFVGRQFDVGAYEIEGVNLIEVDAQQRRRRPGHFGTHRLEQAPAPRD